MELTPRLHLACSLRRQFLDVRNALKLLQILWMLLGQPSNDSGIFQQACPDMVLDDLELKARRSVPFFE